MPYYLIHIETDKQDEDLCSEYCPFFNRTTCNVSMCNLFNTPLKGFKRAVNGGSTENVFERCGGCTSFWIQPNGLT